MAEDSLSGTVGSDTTGTSTGTDDTTDDSTTLDDTQRNRLDAPEPTDTETTTDTTTADDADADGQRVDAPTAGSSPLDTSTSGGSEQTDTTQDTTETLDGDTSGDASTGSVGDTTASGENLQAPSTGESEQLSGTPATGGRENLQPETTEDTTADVEDTMQPGSGQGGLEQPGEETTTDPIAQTEPGGDEPETRAEISDQLEDRAAGQFENVDEGEVLTVSGSGQIEARYTERGAKAAVAELLGPGMTASDVTLPEQPVPWYTIGTIVEEAREEREDLVGDLQRYQDIEAETMEAAQEEQITEQAVNLREVLQGGGEDVRRGNLGDTRDIRREIAAAESEGDVRTLQMLADQQNIDPERLEAQTGLDVNEDGSIVSPDEYARSQAAQALNEETPVELEEGDITFTETTRDGEEVVIARLSEEGEKQIARETAPGQGIPVLEGVMESGAALNYEYEQFAERNRDRVEDVLPDVPDVNLGGVGETVTDIVPSQEDFYRAAAAGAPVAAAEPTPVGEIGVGGLVLAGTTLGVAATWQEGAGGGAGPTSEIDVPSDGELFASEIALSGNADQFVDEMQTPNPAERDVDPIFVPEQGIVIDAGENTAAWNVDELDVADEVYVEELSVPTNEDTDSSVQTVSAQQLVREQQRTRDTGRESGTGRRRSQESQDVPSEYIPEETIIIGGEEPSVGSGFPSVPARQGPGVVIGNRPNVRFVGRRPNPESALPSAGDIFFDTDLTNPYTQPEIVESTEVSTAASDSVDQFTSGPVAEDQGSRTTTTASTDVFSSTGTRPVLDIGLNEAADSASDAAVDAATTTATAVDSAVSASTYGSPEAYEFPEVTPEQFAEPEAVEYGYGDYAPNSPRRPRPPDISLDDSDDEYEPPLLSESVAEIRTAFVDPLTGERGGEGGNGGDMEDASPLEVLW